MICTVCGCAQADGAHFCRACGTRAATSSSEAFSSSGQAGSQRNAQASGQAGGAGSFGPQSWMPLGAEPGAVPAAARVFLNSGRVLSAGRVQSNLQTLGSVWCAWGVLRLVVGLAACLAMETIGWHTRWIAGWPGENFGFMPGFLGAMVPFVACTTLAMSALSLTVGYGLLNGRGWARPLAIVAAVLTLIKLPLGTALGVYTLWVLAPAASGAEYESLTAQP